jgi:hypothetical protein
MKRTDVPIVDLEREAVEDARAQSFARKFLAGAELFDYACEVTKSGIRMQNPEYDDEQVLAELRRRIALGMKTEARE